jgi:lipoprotein-anchoring transpeptidase ErfK/SrfK
MKLVMFRRICVVLLASVAVVGLFGVTSVSADPVDAAVVPEFQPAPEKSGVGRRVVYSTSKQFVWVINARDEVIRTFPVSGMKEQPLKGSYRVFSQSTKSFSPFEPGVTFRFMTRFAIGRNGYNIGFHEIPTKFGEPMQTVEQLGTPLGSGCLRSATADAKFIYRWAKPGTSVVVVP